MLNLLQKTVFHSQVAKVLRERTILKKRLLAKKMTAVSCFIYPRINHKNAYKNSCLGLINNLETPLLQGIVISTGQLSKL